jgi:hypothetical protein
MECVAKLEVWNKTGRIRVVWLEPIPEDYTLLPGERLEIVTTWRLKTPWISVVESLESTQIYIDILWTTARKFSRTAADSTPAINAIKVSRRGCAIRCGNAK